ncbi:signal peptidase II [Olsenella profusa]|uniref:Lipoprotein signal peptidase n=1 Tax=Olsenella profusa TaxID=138595 RepID=A0ABS2F1D6_9ACTN|nr:signal peptidase II [Olsenella profusa]MBM6774770.1 signal peptidase II [Olsenella profusa]
MGFNSDRKRCAGPDVTPGAPSPDGSGEKNVQKQCAGPVADPGAASGARPAARLALFCLAAVLVVLLDQLTKAAARAALVPGEPVTLVPGVMDLTLVYNTGAAFSLGEGAGPVFVAIAAVIAAGGAWLALRRTDAPLSLVLTVAAVAGGGIGNAIDRVAAGAVTDFFDTTLFDFAVFNVADIFVTCGVFLAVALWWRWDARLERERAQADDGAPVAR